jgi:hypothetical protein
MPYTPQTFRSATADKVEQGISLALRFDGRKAFKVSGEMMARITAGRLAERHRGGRMGDVSGASYGTPVHFNLRVG